MNYYNLEELDFLDKNKNNRFLVFVYGRFVEGQIGYNLYLDKTKVFNKGERYTKENYVMYDMKDYPIISDLDEGVARVRGELYDVDAETMLQMDKFMYLYDKRTVELNDETEALTYIMTIRLNDRQIQPDIDNLLTWRRKIDY